MYTPNSVPVYIRANAGCLAGIAASGKWPTDPNASDYVQPSEAADAFAQEVDTIWGGVIVPTRYELDAMQEACQASWNDRSPLPTNIATIPGAYHALAVAIVQMVQQGNAQVVAEGIDPNNDGSGGGVAPEEPVALFVDPQNSTGFASDTNLGQTANNVPPGSGPILTTQENNLRMIGHPNTFSSGSGTILYMSEDTGTVGIDLSPLILGANTLTVQMTRVQVRGVDIFEAGTTPINSATNQPQTVRSATIADWAPFTFTACNPPGTATIPCLVVDSDAGVSAWVSFGSGSATGEVGRPVAGNGTSATTANMTSGQHFTIERPGRLPLAGSPAPSISGGSIIFNDCAFPARSVGPTVFTGFDFFPLQFNRCAFLDPVLVGGLMTNCFVGDGAQGNFIASMNAGTWIPNPNTDQQIGVLNFSGDVYFTNNPLVLGGTFYNAAFMTAGFGSGLQLHHMSSGLGAVEVEQGATVLCIGALLWGKNNAGPFVELEKNAVLTTDTIPVGTGLGGDFTMVTKTTASPWDQTANAGAGAYKVPINCTWANMALAVAGGGFGGAAHDVGLNIHLIVQ